MSATHPFIEAFVARATPAPEPRLAAAREQAAAALSGIRMPARKAEDWRFFALAPVVDVDYEPAPKARNVPVPLELEVPEAVVRVDVVNGRVSAVTGDTPAAFAGSLRDAPDDIAERVRGLLGTAPTVTEGDPFLAVNDAHYADVTVVYVAKSGNAATPIHVLHRTQGAGAPFVAQPRLIIIAERDARATVVEDYATASGGAEALTNAVCEVFVGEGADVRHVRTQREDQQARHVSRVGVRVGRDARYDSVAITMGARSSRTDVVVSQEGQGAWARLDGLALVTGTQETDTHTTVENRVAHCESHQLHKCIVGDRAHAVFNGRIVVREGAQKTEAYQLNRTLLLSKRSKVDTKPQLEIFADDVRCSHGATVGQLDDEELFYLVSRGLSPDVARGVLTYAFAAEVIERIEIPSLVERLEEVARERAGSRR